MNTLSAAFLMARASLVSRESLSRAVPVGRVFLASRAFLVTAAFAVALSPLGSATADDSAVPAVQDVIQARQSGFKKMGAAMKIISEQLKSNAPDLAKIASAAQTISAGAREQPSWFPAGSGPESGVETDALPHIWQDAAKFTALSGQLGVETGNFSKAVTSNDVAAIRAGFKALADVCSTCHKSFRAD
jgi:cytochrome c556